ncbi:MAG TPA: hemagglutinin repeat-containing protein, partial [Burkholderiaceae bacterium]|nr:hemagglutinin repeat-containing protein [Burkholderiaceae bacterium]
MIDTAASTSESDGQSHTRQTGFTLAVSVPALQAAQAAAQVMGDIGKVDDPRMQALALVGAVSSAADAVKAAQAITSGASVSLSFGESRSDSSQSSQSSTALASTVTAAGNVSVHATGSGAASTLSVHGSDIQGGGHVQLAADGALDLQAAQDTDAQSSKNASSSASIGVSVGTSGFMVNVALAMANGKTQSSDVTQRNTHVNGQSVSLSSGGDMTLDGAVVSGNQVSAKVGGNLSMQSLQDTSDFSASQKSMSVSASVGEGASSVSGSASNANVHGSFASVQEQTGIKAGDGGFRVSVAGTTDLKGAVIESSQAAADQGKNSFTTAALTQSDLQNHDSYQAISVQASAGTSQDNRNITPENPTGRNSSMNTGIGAAGGTQSSTTRSGISAGAITLTSDAAQQALTGQTAAQVVASLAPGSAASITTAQDTTGALTKKWNGQHLLSEVQAESQITAAALPPLANAIGTVMDGQAQSLRSQAAAATDATTRQNLLNEAAKYDEGG